MTLSRVFKEDLIGQPIDPDGTYIVQVYAKGGSTHCLPHELVSGEDLLAVAEWIDQQMSQKDDDNEH
jgi:hypothetical protein